MKKQLKDLELKDTGKMITFNDLKSQVYEIAQQRFGHLTDDIKQRLDVELAAIEKYDNSAVIACIWRLFDELYKNNICSQLRIFNEYGVSPVSEFFSPLIFLILLIRSIQYLNMPKSVFVVLVKR